MSKEGENGTIAEVKDDANTLYNQWGGGKLTHTLEMIRDLWDKLEEHGDWSHADYNSANAIEQNIQRIHDHIVKHLADVKKIPESEVKTKPLRFPSSKSKQDLKDWCVYATKAAYATDRFYSHAMRKNPHPKHFDGWSRERYEKDPREVRKPKEQEWLQEEDRLYRIEKRKRRRALAKAKRAAEGHAHHKHPKKEGVYHKKHEPRDRPPPGPSAVRDEKAIPAFPERRVSKPATVPYQRGAARPAQPRVSARLPAFPAFPAYRRK